MYYSLIRPCLFALCILPILASCTSRTSLNTLPHTDTYAFTEVNATFLAKKSSHYTHKHTDTSGFHLITTGIDALQTRLALIEKSEKSIDLQYFSTVDDTTGKLLLAALMRAAKRGVRVRMLIDSWYLDDFKAGAVAFSLHPNIEVRIFNPPYTSDQPFFARFTNFFHEPERVNHRMHNKALIIDNTVALIGGRNLGDEYFDASQEINLQDIDVFVIGKIVPAISINYDKYWNSQEAYPINYLPFYEKYSHDNEKFYQKINANWEQTLQGVHKNLIQPDILYKQLVSNYKQLSWAPAEFAADTPVKTEKNYQEATSKPALKIETIANQAKKEFILFTPYFVPLDDGVEWLASLVQKGVNVRIVTSSLSSSDMLPAQAAYGHYREALVKNGVELYEIKAEKPDRHIKKMFKGNSQNGLHAKIYMIDRRYLVVGSWNFDARSLKLNTEQVLIIESPDLCKKIAQLFNTITNPKDSYRVVTSNSIPENERAPFQENSIGWVTQEEGKTKYYNFNPRASLTRRMLETLFSILPLDRIM